MNGIRGIGPKLTVEQRQEVRRVELKRRALTKMIAELKHERSQLPTSAKLAADFQCCVDTLRKAARGSSYAHDQVSA
jgi:hypothetical protein